jgi:hypothetical protein
MVAKARSTHRRKAMSGRRLASPTVEAPDALKKRRSQWPEPEIAFRPRPSHFAYLRAYAEALDERGPINMAAIARRMGITPQAFWAMRRRCEGLDAWVAQQLGRKNEHYAEPILRKMAVLALSGSVAHAEVYFKVMGRMSGDGATTNVNVQNAGPKIINIAVPRPGDPPVACSSQLLPEAERVRSSRHEQANRREP